MRVNQVLRDRQHTVVTPPKPPSTSCLHRLLRDVCMTRYPGHNAIDVATWVSEVEDKMHLIGIYTVKHLNENIHRINYMCSRVNRQQFYGKTLDVKNSNTEKIFSLSVFFSVFEFSVFFSVF